MSNPASSYTTPPPPPPPPPPHILVIPFPAQGHMIPLLDLSHHLSLHGLTITVLLTPKNLPLLSSSPSLHPLLLPFPSHPSLPSGAENLRDIPHGGATAATVSHALTGLHDPILRWARSAASPPDCIISDFFLGWTHHLATDLTIPRIAFFSSGALLITVLHNLWRHHDHHCDHPDQADLDLPRVPGSPRFPHRHLPSVFRRYRKGSPEWETMRDGMIVNSSSWGVAINTFRGLESAYLDHLIREEYGHGRIWAVGPTLPRGGSSAADRGGRSYVPAGEIATWLDPFPAGSVVYVCFGSQFAQGSEQGEAIAAGLERSGVRFVWIVRADDSAAVPEGFEDRTAGRGMVIRGWAPQVEILNHAAVGSFLSHCGWNSVLEGVMAGVGFLAWPMEADQFVNARLVVEEAGIGVRVSEGPDSVPKLDELARVFAESTAVSGGGGVWDGVRERAKEMGRKAKEAVGEGGSSAVELNGLVRELWALVGK